MVAKEAKLSSFLEGSKQFIIPIYQRTYSWRRSHCDQLWNDILKMGEDQNSLGHFIGSVVYISKGLLPETEVAKLLVIDGQQRLTTILLLLKVLAKKINEENGADNKTKDKIYNKFLFNEYEDEEERYKLLLTKSDKHTFISIIDDLPYPPNKSKRLIDNYEFFKSKVNKTNINLEFIYYNILKLFIVDVKLDRNYDNPQLIFESLNSTGLDLSQADLIRNYILMGQERNNQEYLYNKYWYPMEQSYGYDYNSYFDRFMRDYLTIKTGTIPVMREVYNDFKKYIKTYSQISIENIVRDIKYYSDLYVKLAFAKSGELEIDNAFQDIINLKVEVAYPFILQVFEDYQKERISKNDFIEIIRSIESYVFRRAIVGIPTNSLNKSFANLYKEIDGQNYLESFHASMILKDSYRRFPNDTEFKQEFINKDVYNFRSRNYLLYKLENHNRKETVGIENYTIEHIMPQSRNLSEEWKKMLGDNHKEIQKKYLHTIGNLTLTGYNPELSDKPFEEKRDMEGGFKDSPIRLNKGLAKLDEWNEERILERANELSKKASNIWGFKELDEDTLNKYRSKEETESTNNYSIENFSHFLKDEMLELFDKLKTRILNLDASVRMEYKKLYIAFKNTTNFVDIVPQKNSLRLSLNMDYDEIIDPKGLCRDIENLGRWGNGNVEIRLTEESELDDIMFLIEQSYKKHTEENGE